MEWHSLGLIFDTKKCKWINSHAWVPTVYKIKKDLFRVFFAGRDKYNHSNIGAFTISLEAPYNIISISKRPILKKGRLGCFDDCASIPSHVIKLGKKYFMYYVGWTQGKSVPYISSLGLATSNNLLSQFKRASEAPIFGRTKDDPIFVASCFVEKSKKKFNMWYTSNKYWAKNNNIITPKYYLRLATSNDGINWIYKSEVMKFKSKNEIAITRPWIVEYGKNKLMFYSYRGKNYKIGYAKINKKKHLIRRDQKIKFFNNIDKFDSSTREYSSIIKYKNKFFMFYNGNNFGEKGIGLAYITEDEFRKNL